MFSWIHTSVCISNITSDFLPQEVKHVILKKVTHELPGSQFELQFSLTSHKIPWQNLPLRYTFCCWVLGNLTWRSSQSFSITPPQPAWLLHVMSVVLKLEDTSESPRGFFSFQISGYRGELENLHFQQAPRWYATGQSPHFWESLNRGI